MKSRLPAFILVAAAVAGFLIFRAAPRRLVQARSAPAVEGKTSDGTRALAEATSPKEPGAGVQIVSTSGKPVAPVSASPDAPAALPAAAISPADTTLPPRTVLENMRSTFHLYASEFGGNPVGTNPEITKALMGGNPKHIVFVHTDDGLRTNDEGELVDAWGTPFFFHQLSGTEMEIHSAGPDRRMWTADDL